MIHQLATFLGIVINQSMSEGHKVQLPDFHVKPFLAIFDQKNGSAQCYPIFCFVLTHFFVYSRFD